MTLSPCRPSSYPISKKSEGQEARVEPTPEVLAKCKFRKNFETCYVFHSMFPTSPCGYSLPRIGPGYLGPQGRSWTSGRRGPDIYINIRVLNEDSRTMILRCELFLHGTTVNKTMRMWGVIKMKTQSTMIVERDERERSVGRSKGLGRANAKQKSTKCMMQV